MIRLEQKLRKLPRRRLLEQSDFAYLGSHSFHDLPGGGGVFAQGPALRYVSGQQRFLLLDFTSPFYRLQEITLTGSPTGGGGTFTAGVHWDSLSQTWGSVTPMSVDGSTSQHNGLYYEAGVGLWWNTVGDYPQGGYTVSNCMCLSFRVLNDDGSASGFRGMFGIEGLNTRSHYGGMRRVPTWFKNANSTGPYVTGSGGYSSLFAQGIPPSGVGASLGPLLCFIPDPRGYSDQTDYFNTTANIPNADVKYGADCRSGSVDADWYGGSYASRSFDRGVRLTTPVVNYFDSGQSPQTGSGNATLTNGSTAVTFASAQTLPAGIGICRIADDDGGDTIFARLASSIVSSTSGTFTANYTGAGGTGTWRTKVFPPAPPRSGAQWTTPAPGDPGGYGRWTWGDTYFATMNWIDTDAGSRPAHGIVMIASLARGNAWYEGSTLHTDNRTAEFHVYDPADVALVLAGSVAPYKIRPARVWDVTSTLLDFGDGGGGTSEPGAICGAVFDPIVNRLYLYEQVRDTQNPALIGRMHVFSVAGG